MDTQAINNKLISIVSVSAGISDADLAATCKKKIADETVVFGENGIIDPVIYRAGKRLRSRKAVLSIQHIDRAVNSYLWRQTLREHLDEFVERMVDCIISDANKVDQIGVKEDAFYDCLFDHGKAKLSGLVDKIIDDAGYYDLTKLTTNKRRKVTAEKK